MNLQLLGLSKKETLVFSALRNNANTPLLLSRNTRVSRSAVYAILRNFKKRGLCTTRIVGGRKNWILTPPDELEMLLRETKNDLLQLPQGIEEVHRLGDSPVVIHRGKEAVRHTLKNIFIKTKNARLYGIQGNVAENNWETIFTPSETNEINQYIKRNEIIVEVILPDGWFQTQLELLGDKWAKDFQGRMTRTITIEPEYFDHGAQIFMLKDSIYLLALAEEIIIEIKHSQIQKMLKLIFKYIQDHGKLIDPNIILSGASNSSE